MAVLRASNGGFNIDAFDLAPLRDGTIDQADAGAIGFALADGRSAGFLGHFTYDANGLLSGGTIETIMITRLSSGVGFTISNLSVPAITATLWLANDDTQTALNTIFAGNDDINGSAQGGNLLRGFAGDDLIHTPNGVYADTMFGGLGDDTLVASATSAGNYLRGDEGNDSIAGGTGFSDINGNKGDDTIDGGRGGGDWLVGGQGNDLITAHIGANILYGNIGDDTLNAGSGGDLLRGGQGNDSITGGAGKDWISGDRGNDTMTGGGGADTFHTFSGAGMDRVLDFHISEGDRVQVDAGANYTVSQVGADTVIDMGGGDQMVLVGVQKSTLSGGWIFTL
jgi:Ca2+-binding RTX toxin-like protein